MKNNNDLFNTCSLIEDVCDDDYDHVVDRLVDVYYQLLEYIYECCKEGQICA